MVRRTRTGRAGFSLIELLVVLAVIAILAGLLFPAFATAREKGLQAVCASNMRQLGMAVAQYTADNDEAMPAATDGHTGEGVVGGWLFYAAFHTPPEAGAFDVSRGRLFPYVASARVYVCPDDALGLLTGDSYAINGCVDKAEIVRGLRPGRHLAGFDSPAAWMLFGEEASGGQRVGSTNDGYFDWQTDSLSERHSGGQNVAFVDGHVKWCPATDIIADQMVSGGADPSVACPLW